MYQELKSAAETATRELIEIAKLEEGDLMVVGCSSSEVGGQCKDHHQLPGGWFRKWNNVG